MSLEKARAAIAAAQSLPLEERDHKNLRPIHIEEQFADLMRIAAVHATIAQAEALEKLANLLERVVDGDAWIRVDAGSRVGGGGGPW